MLLYQLHTNRNSLVQDRGRCQSWKERQLQPWRLCHPAREKLWRLYECNIRHPRVEHWQGCVEMLTTSIYLGEIRDRFFSFNSLYNITMTFIEELREAFPKITAAIQLEAGTFLLNTLEDALPNRQVDLALERYERLLSENPSRLYLRLLVNDLHQAVRGEGLTTAERVAQIEAIVQDIHKLRELMKKYRIPSE